MSVKIFDTHAIQTDVLFNTNNRTNNGRRRQKSTAATRLPSQRSPTPRTPPAVIASATRCHAWHPCPVPHTPACIALVEARGGGSSRDVDVDASASMAATTASGDDSIALVEAGGGPTAVAVAIEAAVAVAVVPPPR